MKSPSRMSQLGNPTQMSSMPKPNVWAVAGSREALHELAPLIQAHQAARPVKTLLIHKRTHQLSEIVKSPLLDTLAGLLIIGPRAQSPRRALPGLFLSDSHGRPIPVGWLPEVLPQLQTFAESASAVVRRARTTGPLGPVALLGQWEDRAIRMTAQMEKCFAATKNKVKVFRWTSERIVRRDLLPALGIGMGAALYVGHGRPSGWAGYSGVRARHLQYAQGSPIGVIFSFACDVANRFKVGLSFAEACVLSGICAASFGATKATFNIKNAYLANNVCETLARKSNIRTLGDLLLNSDLTDKHAISSYRILGDPLAPLIGATEAARRAKTVYAPAPDELMAYS